MEKKGSEVRTKVFGSLLASVILGSLVAAGPVAASDDGSRDKPPICKTVTVNAATAPTLTVTVGKVTKTLDVSGIVVGSIKVCVAVDVDVDADLVLTPIVDLKKLCAGLEGNINLGAVVDADATIDVDVTVIGKKNLLNVEKTLSFDDVPVGTSLDVPISVVVCDP